jgi:hypothetical protein
LRSHNEVWIITARVTDTHHMKDPLHVAPTWNEETVGDWVTSATAFIDMESPKANPLVAPIALYLEIDELDEADENEGDLEGGNPPSFVWTVGTDEDSAGFGEAPLEYGEASDLERAKRDCWLAAVAYLRSDTYTEEEIIAAVG